MKVLALIVPALVSASVAAHGATATATAGTTTMHQTTTTTTDTTDLPDQVFNEKSNIPAFFMAACRDGKESIVQHFLKAYPDYARALNTRLPSSGESCLHLAARNGHHDIIDIMIGKGSDPNIKTSNAEYGAPPLYYAVSNGQYAAVKILLRNGADVNQVVEVLSGKKVTCYDILMDMMDRIGDKETAIASGDGDYYRMKEQLENYGAKRYEQLVNNEQTQVHMEL
jgi:ankyrin repeat protein